MAPRANTTNTIASAADSSTNAVPIRPITMSWNTTHTNRPRVNSATHTTRPMHRKTAYSWDEEKLPNDPVEPADIQRHIARRS